MTVKCATYSVVDVSNGSDEATWNAYLRSGMLELLGGYHTCHAISALQKLGVIARLAGGAPVPRASLCALGDRHLIGHLLRYLSLVGILDDSDELSVRTTGRGNAMFSDVALAQFNFYFEAYGPVTRELDKLVTGESQYGRDVLRNGEALGKHSGVLFHRFYTPLVLEVLHEYGASKVLDLGCGGGRSLVDACKRDSNLRGVGLDISEPAIEAARRLAQSEGLQDRLTFVTGDAFRPETWPSECNSADVVTAVGVLHEHFRDGEPAVLALLNRFSHFLRGPARALLLGEPELYFDHVEHDSDFYFAHIITNQGFPRRCTEWLQLIERSELSCKRVLRRPDAGQRLAFYDLQARH
jgi:SAM-dependent methyltransferase